MRGLRAFGWAAEIFGREGADEEEFGRLVWSVGARRCRVRVDGDGSRLTVFDGGVPSLVYEVAGVDLDEACG